ncbi:MAG: cytochrome c, partial [Gammaproteobacteria bacterium]|nr:cytochrome c [Gammaproteobacteria bacterium]
MPKVGLGACLALGAALFASPAGTQQRVPESQPPPQQTPPQPTAPPGAQRAGDSRRGKAISYTCLGCHGIDGYKNAYPMYSV